MINILLYLLEKIPYRTRFGLSLANELKVIYYQKIGQFKNPERCLCGGKVITHTWNLSQYDGSWETFCYQCEQIYDED